MNVFRSLFIALAIATVGTLTWAVEADPHRGHHPPDADSASGAKTMSPKNLPAKNLPDMARMDSQMKTMQEMHEKMLAAKTSEERNALMAEHMKTMQDGMAMMDEMCSRGMGGMKGDRASRQNMMEMHMEMMHSMMQMMMDRLPAAPMK